MNIVVCVKNVPDSETRIKILSDGVSIDESMIKFDANPHDEYALEAAAQLKEKLGGEVTAICLGDDNATSTIKRCLACGADNAIHLVAQNSRMADSLVVAQALADEIKNISFDIILCGKQASDTDSHQVGGLVAQILDVPCISMVNEISVPNKKVTASRDVEGAKEILECSLPCVLTAEKGLNKPRYPSLRDIMKAKKKEIKRKEIMLNQGGIEILSMEYPPPRNAGKIVGEGPEAVSELIKLLKEEAKVL